MSSDLHPDPDTKDWTWTLTRPCPECGVEAAAFDVATAADALEFAAAEWLQVLTSNPAATSRPAPQVWSPLEYGAHVRDVYATFDGRLRLMITEDDPLFPNWDQDATAIESDYASQDPDAVAEQLVAAAADLVAILRGLTAEQLQRPGRRDNGSTFTVVTLSQYLLHDVLHHLWDVTGQRSTAGAS